MLKQIGRYEIQAELGERGKLMVYRAHDPKLDRVVAIKILLPEFTVNHQIRANFRREIELIAALEHPSIIQVYDFGDYQERPYVVMPYMESGTLETRFKDGPLTLRELAPIVERVGAALETAHTYGILHRQVQPANILFDMDGAAYLSDFNIFGVFDDSKPALKSELSLYLSPEQLNLTLAETNIITNLTIEPQDQQAPLKVDHLTDIYSLGVVIFEALTGQLPYKNGLAHLTEPLPQLSQVNPSLPSTWQAIINRAMAKKPAERYQSANQLARHVREVADGRWYLSQLMGPSQPKTHSPNQPLRVTTDWDALSSASQSTIGRYQIEKELGQGGMGIVYKAYDPEIKRYVAIKVLPSEFTQIPKFRERFQQEAEFIARLHHESIVSIYDFGNHEGQPFIVMRYLPGETLAHRLENGTRLPLRTMAPIIEQIATALDAAHQQNIVHQDVKPANIIFDEHGQAFLSDFGIAVIAEAAAVVAGLERNLSGTPEYMSPEQVDASMGASNPIDARSDIYSLGIVLFEALLGRFPYHGVTLFDTLTAHLTDPIPQIATIAPDLPAICQTIFDQALAKNPHERYQTAIDLLHDFNHVANGRWALIQI